MMQQVYANIFSFISQDCPLCLLQFDENSRVPMMLCLNQHLVCKQCFEIKMKPKVPLICHSCKVDVDQKMVKPFRFLYLAIQQTKDLKIKMKKQQSELLAQRRLIKEGEPNTNVELDGIEQGCQLNCRRVRENQLHNLQSTFLNQAKAHFREKQITKCVAICKIILQNNPQQMRQFIGLGSKEQQIGYYEQRVVQWYNEKFKYKQISCYDLLGLCFLIQNNYEQQKLWYQGLKKIDEQNTSILFGLAVTHQNNKKYEEAIKLYNKIIEIDPQFSKPYQMLAFIYQEKQQDHQKMFFMARKALRQDPDNIFAIFLMALYYANQQKPDQYQKYAKEIQKKDSSYVRFLHLKGQMLMKKKDNEQALSLFQKCILNNKYFGQAYLSKGKCLVEMQQFQKAIHPLLLYLNSYDLNNVQCQFLVGKSYYSLAKLDEAEKHLLKCKELKPQHQQVYYYLASIHKAKNQHQKAIQLYEQNLVYRPKDTKSYRNIAKCYEVMKNFKKSIEICEKLYTMDPKNEILVAIGNYHKMDKNYSKALEVYNKCLELDLDNGTKSFIFSKLIQIYESQKNYGKLIQVSARWRQIDLDNTKIYGKISQIFKNAEKAITNKQWKPSANEKKM